MLNFCCQAAEENIRKAAPNTENFPGKGDGFIPPFQVGLQAVPAPEDSTCSSGIPCVPPDPAAPAVKSGSLELPIAVVCSLLGLENRTPGKRAGAAALCMLISTKHMPLILCIRHAAASKKLEHLECFGAVFVHISPVITEHSQSCSPNFIKTKDKTSP